VIVVDASVALKFFLPEVESDAALRLLTSRAMLAAPDILPLELRAAVTKYHRRRLITLDEARAIAGAIGRLAVDLHPWQPLLAPAFELSLLLHHGVYDCLYLMLARQLVSHAGTAARMAFGHRGSPDEAEGGSSRPGSSGPPPARHRSADGRPSAIAPR
jgi:predicted nucleic acid-binding protein